MAIISTWKSQRISLNFTCNWHVWYDVTCRLSYTRNYLLLGICLLIKPDSIQNRCNLPPKQQTHAMCLSTDKSALCYAGTESQVDAYGISFVQKLNEKQQQQLHATPLTLSHSLVRNTHSVASHHIFDSITKQSWRYVLGALSPLLDFCNVNPLTEGK